MIEYFTCVQARRPNCSSELDQSWMDPPEPYQGGSKLWLFPRSWDTLQFRGGLQTFATILVAMAVFSPPPVWDALSSPQVTPAFAIVLLHLVLVNRPLTKLPHLLIAVYMSLGSIAGAALSLPCLYITYAANNRSYDQSVTKAAVLLTLATPLVGLLTMLRFTFTAQRRFGMTILTLTFVMAVTTTYWIPDEAALWQFPLYYAMNMTFAAVFAAIIPSLVVPTPSGMFARRLLATCFRTTARALTATVEQATACEACSLEAVPPSKEPQEGSDAAADGGTANPAPPASEAPSVLDRSVVRILNQLDAADWHLQDALIHINSAQWEWDVYRPTHRFPVRPFNLLAVEAHATLSTVHILLQAFRTAPGHSTKLQDGELRAAAAAFQECYCCIADAVEHNRPMRDVVDRVMDLQGAMDSMAAAVRAEADEGKSQEEGGLGLSFLAALLVAACARLYQMCAVLPFALSKDQPDACSLSKHDLTAHRLQRQRTMKQLRARNACLMPTTEPFCSTHLGAGKGEEKEEARPKPHLLQLREAMGGRGTTPLGGPAAAAAVHAGGAEEVAARLGRKSVMVTHAEPEQVTRLQQASRGVMERLGLDREALCLGVQLMTGFFILMIFTIIPAIHSGLGGVTQWAMIMIVVLFEPSSGSMVFKSMMRILGTVLGAGLGMAVFYIAVAADGWGYANSPQKFIVSSLLLGIACGVNTFLAVRRPRTAYMYLTSCVITVGTALPNFSDGDFSIAWRLGLWRLANTGVGVGVQLLVVTLVFPVTSSWLLRDKLQLALTQLADALSLALGSVLPTQDQGQGAGAGAEATPQEGVPREASGLMGGRGGDGINGCSNSQKRVEGTAEGRGESCGCWSSPSRLPGVLLGGVRRLMSSPLSTGDFVVRELQGSEQLLGPVYMRFFVAAFEANSTLTDMLQVIKDTRYELNATSSVYSRPARHIALTARTALQTCLDLPTSFAATMDAHSRQHVQLLEPHRRQAERLIQQLKETLVALSSMVGCRISINSAAIMALALGAHMDRLSSLMLMSPPDELIKAGRQGSEITEAVAFMAMLHGLEQTVRHLCIRLVQLWWGEFSEEADHLKGGLLGIQAPVVAGDEGAGKWRLGGQRKKRKDVIHNAKAAVENWPAMAWKEVGLLDWGDEDEP